MLNDAFRKLTRSPINDAELKIMSAE
jgi:hypothetical protein